jgi:hypothetical protein
MWFHRILCSLQKVDCKLFTNSGLCRDIVNYMAEFPMENHQITLCLQAIYEAHPSPSPTRTRKFKARRTKFHRLGRVAS